jgi:hypothetical protein
MSVSHGPNIPLRLRFLLSLFLRNLLEYRLSTVYLILHGLNKLNHEAISIFTNVDIQDGFITFVITGDQPSYTIVASNGILSTAPTIGTVNIIGHFESSDLSSVPSVEATSSKSTESSPSGSEVVVDDSSSAPVNKSMALILIGVFAAGVLFTLVLVGIRIVREVSLIQGSRST